MIDLKKDNPMPSDEKFASDMLDAYRRLIKEKAESKSDDLLPNSGNKHAAIMLTEMFRQTTTSMVMVAGCFSGEVSSDKLYLKELESLLKRGVEARFIVLENANQNSEALQLITRFHESNPSKVSLKKATPTTIETLETKLNKDAEGKLPHFAAFDDAMFRLEVAPSKFIAIGSFNNRDNNDKLREIFKYISASAEDFTVLPPSMA